MLDAVCDDLPRLRDRTLLMISFTGALRRSELTGIEGKGLESCDPGLHLTLPHSKHNRHNSGGSRPLPYGSHRLCLVRALQQWMIAVRVDSDTVFRQAWRHSRCRRVTGRDFDTFFTSALGTMGLGIGTATIEPRTVARIIQTRAAWAVTASSTMRSLRSWTITCMPCA